MDMNEVHRPINITLFEENEILMDEGAIPPNDALLNEDEIVPDDANHEESIPIDEFPRENVIPDDAAYQRNEDNGLQQPRRSIHPPQYSERFLDLQRTLTKRAIFSGLSAEVHEVKTEYLLKGPSSYREAVSSVDSKFLIPVIFEEYDLLVQNDTWTLCPLPPGRKVNQRQVEVEVQSWIQNNSSKVQGSLCPQRIRVWTSIGTRLH